MSPFLREYGVVSYIRDMLEIADDPEVHADYLGIGYDKRNNKKIARILIEDKRFQLVYRSWVAHDKKLMQS